MTSTDITVYLKRKEEKQTNKPQFFATRVLRPFLNTRV